MSGWTLFFMTVGVAVCVWQLFRVIDVIERG